MGRGTSRFKSLPASFNNFEDLLHRKLCDAVLILFHSCQGREEKGRFGDVIETNDSKIFRDPQSSLAGNLYYTQSHLIVANEKRIHFHILFKKFFECLRATLR